MQKCFIQWFGKTHIIMTRIQSIVFQVTDSRRGKITGMTKGKNRNILSVPEFTSLADFNFFHRGLPLWHHAFATGVTDHHREFSRFQLGRIHQVTQFTFIHG